MSGNEITFTWDGRDISLVYQPRYCDVIDHVEIRSADGDPLPITGTGYRSHFYGPMEPALSDEQVITFVTDWLNREAKSKAWQSYLEQSKQLSLF